MLFKTSAPEQLRDFISTGCTFAGHEFSDFVGLLLARWVVVIPCPVVESLAAFEEIVVNGKLGKGSAQPIKEAEELISNGLQNVVYGCDLLRGNVLHLQR